MVEKYHLNLHLVVFCWPCRQPTLGASLSPLSTSGASAKSPQDPQAGLPFGLHLHFLGVSAESPSNNHIPIIYL